MSLSILVWCKSDWHAACQVQLMCGFKMLAACLRRSYLLAYNSHQLKDIFNVHTLDLVSVAKSFGFSQPPRVGLFSL